MLDTTAHTSISSADPDALAFLARSLWDYGNATQQQTSRLWANGQTADHGSALNGLASRFTKSGAATEAVAWDFAHADQRVISSGSNVLGISQTIRRRPIVGNARNSAPRSANRAKPVPKVRAAVVGRKRTVTRVARVTRKPTVRTLPKRVVPKSQVIAAARIISALQVRAMLRVAGSQVGVREQRTNRTKYGRWYGMNGQAWCAMFVSWVGAQAGVPLPRINSHRGFAGVVSGRNFARKNNLLTKTPRVGSVFLIIGRNGKGHTGLVESINWARRTITTIEGNTNVAGSRNGDGVYRRTRKISTINGGFMLIPRPKVRLAKSKPRAK